MDVVSSEEERLVNERWPAGELISAGEVGQFVFCPESWRLKRLMGQRGELSEKSDFGKVEHEDWGGVVDRLEAVRFGLRVLFGLCVAACILLEWGNGR